jgi:hypothetical protein
MDSRNYADGRPSDESCLRKKRMDCLDLVTRPIGGLE